MIKRMLIGMLMISSLAFPREYMGKVVAVSSDKKFTQPTLVVLGESSFKFIPIRKIVSVDLSGHDVNTRGLIGLNVYILTKASILDEATYSLESK